jgi:hypothetical protein
MTALTVLDPHPPELGALVERVNREHALVHDAGQSMLAHAIAAGDALLECKRLVTWGGWEDWLKRSFPDKHPKTLRTYMRIAKYRTTIEKHNPPTLSAAHRLLAGEAMRPHSDELKSEARRLRKAGLTYAEIGVQLNIGAHTANCWLNPRLDEKRRQRRKQMSRVSRRALQRSERDREARKVGGSLAHGYAFVRKSLEALEAALDQEGNADSKQAIVTAMQRLYAAEDLVCRAISAHSEREQEAA